MGKDSVKELNDRIGKLHEQFQKELSDVKKALKSEKKATGDSAGTSRDCDLVGIDKKLENIEATFFREINLLRSDVLGLEAKVSIMQDKWTHTELLNNKRMIVIHGLPETSDGNLGDYVIGFIANRLNFKLNKGDISDTYRIGRQKKNDKKIRPVVVEFCDKWIRNEVYYKKRSLKGTKIMITERLTSENLMIFKEVRQLKKNDCWTKGGIVFASNNGKKMRIGSKVDVEILQKLTLEKGGTVADGECDGVNDTSQLNESDEVIKF